MFIKVSKRPKVTDTSIFAYIQNVDPMFGSRNLISFSCIFCSGCLNSKSSELREKVRIRRFSGSYFPVFGLNKEIHEVNLRVQPEYRKKRTSKNSVFGLFSRSAYYLMDITFGHLLNVLFAFTLRLATA